MSETGWAEWLAGQRAEESPAEGVYRRARQIEQRVNREAAVAEAERAAQLEDERDRRLMAYQHLGIGGRALGDMAADASRAADEDDQYQEALKTIERIDKRRAARAEAQRYQAEQVASIGRAVFDDGDIYAQAQRRAHRAFAQHTRGLLADAAAGTPRRESRPKGISRSRGVAVRSEHCTWCTEFGVSDEHSYLLHSDPERNVPVTPPGTVPQAEQAEQARQVRAEQPEHAERRGAGRYAEIVR